MSATLTRDGSILAAVLASYNTEPILCIWEVSSGRVIYQIRSAVTALAFSPDGTALATADTENKVTIRFLDSAGSEEKIINVGRSAVRSLALQRLRRMSEKENPDWELAVGDTGGTVKVWDVEEQTQLASCLGGSFNVNAVAFSPDGTMLASGGNDPVRVWDAATGRHLLDLQTGGSVKGIDFSPDGKRLAVGVIRGYDKDCVQVWEFQMGRGVQTLHGLSARVIKVVLSADGQKIGALSHNWEVGVWSLATGELLRRISVPPGIFADNAALAFSPDGRCMAFSALHSATLWDLDYGRLLNSWPLPGGLCDCLTFDPFGRLLLVRAEAESNDSKRRRYIVRNLLGPSPTNAITEITNRYAELFDTQLLDDGSSFIVAGEHESKGGLIRSLSAFETLTGRTLWASVSPRTAPFMDLRVDSQNTLAAYEASDSDAITVIDVFSGTSRLTLPRFPGAFGPGGRIYANSQDHIGIGLFGLGHDQPMVTLGMDCTLNASFAKFDRTARLLACGNADGTVLVFNLDEINQRLGAVGLGWEYKSAP